MAASTGRPSIGAGALARTRSWPVMPCSAPTTHAVRSARCERSAPSGPDAGCGPVTARQQWLTVLGAVCVLALALAAATHFLGDELFPVSVGSAAPPIVAATLDA